MNGECSENQHVDKAPRLSGDGQSSFRLGFWFNNPQHAAACGFPASDPSMFTPFSGEHKAGLFAMITVLEQSTQLAPLWHRPIIRIRAVAIHKPLAR
jgi:hypothetical protein